MPDVPGDPTPELKPPSWAGRVREMRVFDLFEKYRRRVVHHETDLPFPPTERAPHPLSLERLAFETRGGLKLALQAFPPVCLLVFFLSFFWDWHGLMLSCSVAGLIGFGTNWVAIKMLFWPRESRPVFGYGLIPSQRDDLVNKVATEVLENLINEKLILEKVHETRIVNRFSSALIGKLRQVAQDPEFKEDLRQMVLTYIGEVARDPAFRARLAERADHSLEEFAGERFRGFVVRRLKDLWRGPLVDLLNREIENLEHTFAAGMGPFEQAVEKLPQAIEARQEEIDRVLTNMLVGMVREVDLRAIIYEQLEGVTPQQLEQSFREFSDDKLDYITLLGGIFGVIGGTVLIWPFWSLVVIVTGVALLWVADIVLYRILHGRWSTGTD
jgi:uncharacterized membrane protein YheB (UPF0754 family)